MSLFGLGESQGGFSHADFISSREILKLLSSFSSIFSTVLVIDLGCLVVSKLVCLVSVVILVNHATDSRRNIFRNDGVLLWLEFQRFDSVSWRVSFFRIVDTACPSSLVAIHLANKAFATADAP